MRKDMNDVKSMCLSTFIVYHIKDSTFIFLTVGSLLNLTYMITYSPPSEDVLNILSS